MAVRLIALDMDGTLLNSKKQKPADFIPWVLSHPQYRVAIASGRQYYTLLADFPGIGDELYFIAENGGFVFFKGAPVYTNVLRTEDVKACLDRTLGLSCVTPIVCGAVSAYMRGASAEALAQGGIYYAHLTVAEDLYACAERDAIAKIALYVADSGAEALMDALPPLPEGIVPVLSGESWIDLSSASSTKGAALTALRETLGIERAECMAFGDYLNDRTLIEAAGESYCMANGHPDLKAIAKHIAESNDDDGVMKVLRTLP